MNYARRLDRRATLRNKRRLAVKDQIRRGLLAERLEDRSLMAADALSSFHSDYWNMNKPTDVTADGMVAPNDALAVINELNTTGTRQLPQGTSAEGEAGKLYFDVNNDGFVSPADALAVINELNGEGAPPILVAYSYAILDSSGNPISGSPPSIQVGQDFFVQMNVQDLRTPGSLPQMGVYAAYTDLLYNKQFAAVAVAEVQTITFSGATSGTFNLKINTQDTGPITYNNTSVANRNTTAASIATALNGLLGANAVTVTSPTSTTYRVTFSGKLNIDEPTMTSDAGNVAIAETVKGDPTVPASFLSAIQFSSQYANGKSGADGTTPDRIDELGSFFSGDTSVGAGTDPVETLRIHMLATLPTGTTSGTETFTPDFTNVISPDHDTLILGQDGAVPHDQITSTGVTLSINSGPINVQSDSLQFDEDTAVGAATTVNVLTNDSKNPGAPAGALQVLSFTQPSSGGTVAYQNPADHTNGNLVFTPTLNFNGTATFTYTAGIVGDANVATATVTVTINPVNDAPVITVTQPVQTTPEDTAKVINGISLVDVDADAAAVNPGVKMTLTATNGTVTLNGTAGLTFTTGTGTNDSTMVFTGLTSAVNTAIAGLTFTPSQDFNGTANLVVKVEDQGNTGNGGPLQDLHTVTINVTPVNDAPVNQIGTPPAPITPGTANLIAIPDSPLNFTGDGALSVKDVDAGANFSVTLTLDANTGTLSLTPSGATVSGNGTANVSLTGSLTNINTALGTLIYNPQTGFTNTTHIVIVSNDGSLSDTDTLGIDVIPPNKPFARNDSITFDEGTTAPQTINVLANDLTNTGAVAELESFTQPLSGGPGSVALFDNGTPADKTDDKLIYTPPAASGGALVDFNGTVRFTYVMNEVPATNSNGPSTATVTVIVNPVNDAPVANDDNYSTAIGVPLTVTAQGTPKGVLFNDTDVDGDTLTAVNAVIAAGQGSVSLGTDGGFTYTPPAGGGDFTFTYQAKDPSNALSNTATVHIHVAAPPVAVNDPFTTAQEDQPFTSPTSVLANDSDPTEHQSLSAVLVTNVPASAGSVSLGANGIFVYTPAQDFNTTRPPVSPITFTYKATAGGRDSNIATVSITVNEVNDNPTAHDDTFTAVKNNGTVGIDQPISVLGNDSFAPDVNETLSVTGIGTTLGGPFSTGPTATTGGGSVKVVGGQILYTSPSTTGNDSFTYQISDGRGGTASATVNVTVVDFVPKSVSGTVYVDSNNNGQIDSGEKLLSNVEVHLTGTDFLNQAVSLVTFTDISGGYTFAGLKPPKAGTPYTISEVQPAYLLSGLDTNGSTSASATLVTNVSQLDNLFAAAWIITDSNGNITNLNFGERGIDFASLSDSSGILGDYLASSGGNGFVIAADLSSHVLWNWSLPGWENAKSIGVSLDPSLNSLLLTVVDKQNNTYSVTLTTGYSIPGSTARFRILGIGTGGQYIIRIDASANGATDGVGMNLLAAAPGSGGEGEAPANPEYANSADAVFSEQAWA
jgi:cadherin-like protein/Big-like domain-containing protein/dockerin type I repeat protein/SdrD B-like protein